MDQEKLVSSERLRAQVYQILSVCFCEPQKEFLEEEIFTRFIESLQILSPEAVAPARAMAKAAVEYSEQELLVEYSRLFLGPFRLPAPPYGSVYLEEGRMLMGRSTIEVANLYHNAGLSLSEDTKDLPDHIAVELEFMYFLVSSGLAALAEPDLKRAEDIFRTGQAFLESFLAPFVVPFTRDMEKETQNRFYGALAACLRAFVLADQRYANQRAVNFSAAAE